eukprot:TRINITY_DN6329_c0_g1_i10.p1 TRINITY_DN6329_c0_g1~~TRINITY_DN6329_c0_g1_i10.p1  ORF type:complete len:138 (+),score=80.27 TRINITY_DN6329_c0_g1_i10:1070-1483(+)
MCKTYLKHFEVFAYVMGTEQRVRNKKVTIYIDEPISVLPLKCAREIVPEVEEKVESREEKAEEEVVKEEEAQEEKKEEEETPLEKLIEALSLSEEEKERLYAKLKEMREDVENKLAEREKGLLNTIAEMKTKGKKKK